MDNQDNKNYAYLPDDLLVKILDKVPNTVDKMNRMFDVQDEPINEGIAELKKQNLINKVSTEEHTSSLIAVDGSNIVEKMTGTDILLAIGVGVEGLAENKDVEWGERKNQYYQYQTVLPHGEANARLIQGIMFLMELSVLAQADHEVRIMDGNHLTPILKVNSMLSAKDENAGKDYCEALSEFLKDTYDKIIPDIPDIISAAFSNDHIIAMAKYSSSRDIIESYLGNRSDICVDDKTFFSLGLEEDEYLKPLPVGQSKDENRIWGDLHIKCNLDTIEEKADLNEAFAKTLEKIKTKDLKGKKKESDIYFTYYKPYKDGPAYRIEIKKSLATDQARFEKYFEPILEKQEEADYVKARERADFFMDNFEFIKEEEIVKIDPKRIKDNVPIFISPGWGVSPNSQKETLEVIADKERRVVTVDFIREQILKDKEDDGLQIAELQKSLAIVQALEKSGLEKVDAIGHSEGGLNLVIAAMLYPEKFRNIVLVAPAGITGKESYLNLIKRFTIDEGMEEMRASANNMNSFYEYFKNLSKYFIKNESLSKQEIKEMSESDILEVTKVLKQKGVGISVVCGVNDKVFPIENVINRVNASNLDHFISTKGNHGSFIFNKKHALLAENILSNMRRE